MKPVGSLSGLDDCLSGTLGGSGDAPASAAGPELTDFSGAANVDESVAPYPCGPPEERAFDSRISRPQIA